MVRARRSRAAHGCRTLAAAIAAEGRRVLIVDPLDALRRPVGMAAAMELHAGAPEGLEVTGAAPTEELILRIEGVLYREAEGRSLDP